MSSKKLRAALYARFSTDQQRVESIADQFYQCEKIAEREGFEIVDRFSDAAISGGTATRPGYQKMLTAARDRKFDVLICEDISRLTRNRAEFGPRSAELEDLKVNLVTATGDDTRRDGWGLTIQIKLAMSEHARREASYRTRRGLEGKAKDGAHAGGKSYGYTSVDKVRVVDEAQAKIVKQIFEWRAAGWSGQRIARQLNDDGVPSPGSTWARTDDGPRRKVKAGWRSSAILGDPKRGCGILNNDLYRGKIVWGKSKWTRSAADSSKRTPSRVNPSEWITHDDESLRIVSDELWNAVYKIQNTPSPKRDAIAAGIAKYKKGRDSKYLFGSLFRCSCGSSYIGHGKNLYHCAGNHANNCTNDLRFNREEAHDAVHGMLKDHLKSPRQLELAQSQVLAWLREEERAEADKARGIETGSDVKKLDAQLAALRKLSLPPAAMAAAVDAIETERAALIAARTGSRSANGSRVKKLMARIPQIMERYVTKLDEGARALSNQGAVADAREAARNLLLTGSIVLKPMTRDGVAGVSGLVELKGLGEHLLELAGLQRIQRKSLNSLPKELLVAGARFS